RYYSVHRPDKLGVYWLTYFPGTSILSIAQEKGYIGTDEARQIDESVEGTTYYNQASRHDKVSVRLLAYLNWVVFLPDWLNRIIINRKYYRLWPADRLTYGFALFLHLFMKKRIPFWNAETRLFRKTVDYVGRVLKARMTPPLARRLPTQRLPDSGRRRPADG